MRPTISLKTLLRAPFKTFMTFLLIATATFALFYRVTDYAVTQREMKRITSYYRGVAALDNGVQNTAMLLASFMPNSVRHSSYYREEKALPDGLPAKQIDSFSNLPGVDSTDIRYMTAGIIDGLDRVARYGPYNARYDYTDRFVIEGTYTGCFTSDFGGSAINNIKLTDCKQLAGNIPIEQGSDVSVVAFADSRSVGITRGDMRLFYFLQENIFDQSFVDSLVEGDRCLIIGRWDPRYLYDSRLSIMSLYIGDQDTLDYTDSFHLLKGKPDNYLETDEFARVREIIEITNRDLKTFDMVYTSDMLSIPRFNEKKMVIQEGRALSSEDKDACVVNYSFLVLNELKVGDKLTVDLCDKLLPQNSGMGATAVIPERFGAPVRKVELEIVGAYVDADAEYERDAAEWWGYSPNTIFVPTSLLPIPVPDSHIIRPGEFSLVIDDALLMEAFLNKAELLAKEQSISLRFSDSGWLKIKDSLDTSQTMTLITTVLYIASAAVALLLGAYLYIGRQKKIYAIMRALGTPHKKAGDSIVLPFTVLSIIGVILGSILGAIYASASISSALDNLALSIENYIPDTSLPVWAIVTTLLFEVAYLILLCSLIIRRFGKTPVLALLQGSGIRKRGRKGINHEAEGELLDFIPISKLSYSISSDMPERGGYGPIRHVTGYILLHVRRAGGKTILGILLATLLTGVIGLLAVTRLSYHELFDKTKLVGTVSNYSSSAMMDASKTELMKNFYYSGGFSVICNDIPSDSGISLAITNDIDRYIQSKSTEGYFTDYIEGYDVSIFMDNKPLCIMGEAIANAYGVKPGDSISLLSWERQYVMSMIHKEDEELISQLEEASLEFQVVGVISSEDPQIGIGIYTMLSKELENISEYVEYPFPVEFGEFELVNKENPHELRGYLDNLARIDSKYIDAMSYNIDTRELDNIKRVRDMLVLLFPLAVAGAVLIGLTASGLIVMQSAKEAAILRILGTTKLRVRCMLSFEQISLCILGLILAALGLAIYNPGLFIRSVNTLLSCGALYVVGCATVVILSSTLVTRRKILELLQVKE